MKSIRDLIANDGYAMSFQSMGQYRTALLKALDSAMEPVGVLHISDFRGMENADFQQLSKLPPGRYELFTAPRTKKL
jgi:hypothetical protein